MKLHLNGVVMEATGVMVDMEDMAVTVEEEVVGEVEEVDGVEEVDTVTEDDHMVAVDLLLLWDNQK